jgi:hypothetical protein
VEQESQEARGGEIGVALNASTRAGRQASRKGAPPACDTGSGSRVVLVNPAYPYPVSPYPVPCPYRVHGEAGPRAGVDILLTTCMVDGSCGISRWWVRTDNA